MHNKNGKYFDSREKFLCDINDVNKLTSYLVQQGQYVIKACRCR